MEINKKKKQDYYVIDILHILKSLWSKVWAIILIGLIVGAMVLCFTMFFVVPQYSASVMLYVNNSSLSIGSTSVSISASELSAAQSLVDTYIVILNNKTTMKEVIDKTGVDNTPEELMEMIKAESVNGTEVFKVTVTTDDPYEAAQIANCIAEVLPMRVEDIIEGSSMKLVDDAEVDTQKVSPSITKNTVIGVLLGCLGACILFTVIALFDDTIRNDDNISDNYEVPILSKIPDLAFEDQSKKYSYYSGYGAKNVEKGKGGV